MDGSSRGTETSTWAWVVTAFVGASGEGSHLFTDLFFFSPSDFKIKIKNFKKEFKEKKKKKKTSVVKKPIFRTQIRYFRALGLNSVVFPSGHRRGLLSTVPFVEVTSCGHCLAHADALSGKPGFPRDSSTPFHVFCHPTPSTEDVIKKNNNKK